MSGQPPPQWPPGQQPVLYPQQYPPQYPPHQVWYPPIPPPPKNDSKIVAIIVVVVVLVIVVPTVAAFVLYTMVSGLIEGPGLTTRPVVTFAQLTKDGTPPNNHTVMWNIAGVSEPVSAYSKFKVQLMRDGSPLVTAAQSLVVDTKIAFGASVTLIVRDLAGEGKLTGGDAFVLYGMTEPHNWKFSLIWAADGTELQSASWQTP